VLSRIAEAAQDQWGLITRRQAKRVGVPQTTMERLTAPGSVLDRVAHGVYRMAGAPEPEHLALRAAWLQLKPGVWAWERTPAQGVVSHRSAAALYGLGDLPADRHEFTLPSRKQTRRPDVRLHLRSLSAGEWVPLGGLPVTRPARIASDLLDDHEDPEGVAHIVADAIRGNYDYPGVFTDSLAAQASRFGLRRGDGLGVMRWLLDLVGDPATPRWLDEARVHLERESARSCGNGWPSGGARWLRHPRPVRRPPPPVVGNGLPRKHGVRSSPIAGTLDEATGIVRPFADPLLERTAAGQWEPTTGRWSG
jgi:hypothetical protein